MRRRSETDAVELTARTFTPSPPHLRYLRALEDALEKRLSCRISLRVGSSSPEVNRRRQT
jgi:hypothetical protein